MVVRALDDDDGLWKDESLRRAWGSTAVARLGTLVDAAGLPGFVALADGRPIGLLTCARVGDDIEVVTLHVDREGRGTGRALMDAVLTDARRTAARRIWLVTTNDNTRAVAFYRRWGMHQVATITDGVAASRQVKPSIPVTGRDGIPVRDELVFDRRLDDGPLPAPAA